MNGIKSASGLVLLFLFVQLTSFAQKNYTGEADAAFKNYSFHQAIELYKKAYSKEKKFAEKKRILFKIGQSYFYLQDNEMAENWLSKADKAGYSNPEVKYFLAESLRKQGKFEEALVEYKNYKELAPDDKRGQRGIKSCELAQEWKDNPTRYEVRPEQLLNSKQADFAPVFADRKYDEIIFTSTREGATGNSIDPNTGQNYSSLFYSKQDRKGKWMVPTLLEGLSMEESNEGGATMDKRYRTLYFTRCIDKKNSDMGCDIYTAKQRGRAYAEPEMIPIDKPDSNVVGHPSMGLDDEYMFFASDMPGGKGGKDIWFVKYDSRQRSWGEPVNVEGVNTDGDEMYPFIREDGNLYFASNGHPGMGGLDIFKSTRQGKSDSWSEVENMQYPMNSSSNDFGIIFEGSEEKGFFSSDRSGGRGGDDIWSFRIPPLKFVIDGMVSDVETGEPIANATIEMKGTDGSTVQVTTDELGYYQFDQKEGSDERYVKANTSYTLLVSAEGYLNGKGQETTVGVQQSTRFKHDFKLQSIKQDEIEFPEVRYDLGEWELQVNDSVNSKDSLDYLYQVLVDNPNIVVELMAHTDTRGSAASNQTLSQKRAQSCVDYLISKGIAAERMEAKGYGENEPRISDAEIAKLPTKEEKEAAHQKNRRTTFRVIRDDYVPKDNGDSGDKEPQMNNEGEQPMEGEGSETDSE